MAANSLRNVGHPPVVRLAVAFLTAFYTAIQPCTALQLGDCPSGRVEVEEGSTSFSLTCSGYSTTVTWLITSPSGQVTIGTCNSSSCAPDDNFPLKNIITLTRQSASSSRLTSKATAREYAGYVYKCRNGNTDDKCVADIFYKADVSSCTIQANRDPWRVTGSCKVDKAFSSQNNYRCTVFQGTSQVASETYAVQETTESGYYSGTCSFTSTRDFPTETGNYSYRFVVDPGATQYTSSPPVAVVKASSPTITGCPPDSYVRENSTITCRCTANVGTPPGHLVWKKIKPTNKIINTGNVNVGQLDMTPQTLTRHDHDVTQFRCDVQWAVLVEGNTYTARVGYGPEATTLKLNSKSGNLTVMENESVVFDCQGNGRPTPNMVLVNQGSGVGVNKSQSSPLTHIVSRARCEDAAVYTCTASNGIGRDQQATRTLHVNCKPRSDLSNLPTLNYNNQTVTQSFDVIASPVPHEFTFTFNGPNVSSDSPGQEVKDANLSAACVSVPGSLYRSRCHVTVFSINSPSAVGFYTVRVANTHGHQDFTFQLTTDGTETPGEKRESEGSTQPVAIGLGVSAAVVVVVAIVLVVVFLRRHKKEPDTQKLHNSVDLDSNRLADDTGAHGVVAESEEQDASTDVYAVVNKPTKSPAMTSSGQSVAATDTVVKKIKSSHNGGSATQPHPPATKPKPKKSKTEKGKSGDKERTEHEYGNLMLSMAPAGNSAADTEKTGNKKTEKSAGGGAARKPNQDGLLYTMVDFSGQGQQSTKPATPPDQQGVVYSDVLFNTSITKQ